MLVAAIFSRRCATEEVPGMSRIVAECCSSHASATCRGDAPSRAATASSTADCNGVNPPRGKKGCMQCLPVRSDRRVRGRTGSQRCSCSARRRRVRWNAPRELLSRHVADPEMPDQALPPQLREDGERFRDRAGRGTLQTTDAQVDHVESLQPEMLEMQAETGVLPKVLLTARSLA